MEAAVSGLIGVSDRIPRENELPDQYSTDERGRPVTITASELAIEPPDRLANLVLYLF
jgi:hypothetical protein